MSIPTMDPKYTDQGYDEYLCGSYGTHSCAICGDPTDGEVCENHTDEEYTLYLETPKRSRNVVEYGIYVDQPLCEGEEIPF